MKDNIKILGHHRQVSVEGLLKKVQVLETQLADAAEANNMYKEQLKRLDNFEIFSWLCTFVTGILSWFKLKEKEL